MPVVNLDGVSAGQLVLDGPTLANIFLGKITKWDDPAIAKLNPSVKLPSQAIVVVHRSDGSGTTFIFTNYLSKVSADWKSKVGASTAVEWPVGIGAKGNEGVVEQRDRRPKARSATSNTPTPAEQDDLGRHDQRRRQDGRAERRGVPGRRRQRRLGASPTSYYVILTNQPGATTWPIAGATFILMYKQPDDTAAVGRSAQVLQLGLHQRRQAGRGARLRAAAGRGRRSDQEDLGREHHHGGRQAGVRRQVSVERNGKPGRFVRPGPTPGAALPPRRRSSVGGRRNDRDCDAAD